MSNRAGAIDAVLMDHGADSFAYNVLNALYSAGANVTKYLSNTELRAIRNDLDSADLIVLGPGCDGPDESGNYCEVISEYGGKKPMLGLCLGHQTMLYHDGIKIGVLPPEYVKHAIICEIEHDGRGIFDGVGQHNQLHATRYNSLAASVGDMPDGYEVSARETYPELQGDKAIVMGFRRKRETRTVTVGDSQLFVPVSAFYVGVQFHPESCGSYMHGAGPRIFKNLVRMAREEKELQRKFLGR